MGRRPTNRKEQKDMQVAEKRLISVTVTPVVHEILDEICERAGVTGRSSALEIVARAYRSLVAGKQLEADIISSLGAEVRGNVRRRQRRAPKE